jgi:hypothetical protein
MVPIFIHLLIDTFNRLRASISSQSHSGSPQHHDEQRLGRILIQCQDPHLIAILKSSPKTGGGGGDNLNSPNQKLFSSFLETCLVWSSLTESSLLRGHSGAMSLVDIDQCRVNIFHLLEEHSFSSSHGMVPTVMELVSEPDPHSLSDSQLPAPCRRSLVRHCHS